MSERYSRLFTLPENLYAEGSPVVIAAGALLKDNQTGKVIAQLKLKSISPKNIRAVKVKLNTFDTAGNPLEEAVVHDYLDLNISRDKEFAQKNPVQVGNNKARSYKASIQEVVYTDGSVWSSDNESWESLSKPDHLAFSDPELLKQYKLKFGKGSVYEPKEEKGLWHCTCGALNHKDEMCHCCHNSLLALQTVDITKLKADKDARLKKEAEISEEKARQAAEEREAREAAARKAKQNRTKFLKILVLTVCTVIVAALLATKVIIPNIRYNNAVALMETDVIQSYETLVELDDYKDSKEKANTIYYEYITQKRNLAEIGDYVFFGSYEQDNDISNGGEDVEWLVLDKKDNKILVVSRYALDYRPYNTLYANVTWETCSIRQWLNNEFICNAFSTDEQMLIVETTVSADKNRQYDTEPGRDTKDQIFLLSIKEVELYWPRETDRICALTDYAATQSSTLFMTGSQTHSWWWLRTPGGLRSYATYVYSDGRINYFAGNGVDEDYIAVRPAMWITIEP